MRYLCANEGRAQRKGLACSQCGFALQRVEVPHSGFGVGMWVLAGIGGACVPLAFIVHGILILVGIGLLVVALALNVADDRTLDREAGRLAVELSRRTPRCPRCRNALMFDPATGRWFCPSCRIPVEPPLPPHPAAA